MEVPARRRACITRWCPIWTLACTASRKAARLAFENRRLRKALAVANADRAGLRLHFELAVDHRNHARDLAAALADAAEWSTQDAAFLETGVWPGVSLDDEMAWQRDAACRGSDPALFFTERGESTAEAKAICAGCPVRAECLEYALETDQRHGLWGGLSERGRRRIRNARRRGAAA